jgi:polyphosphate kinase
MVEVENLQDIPKCAPYMQNRELSWLEFNKRVLDQGLDPTVPLLNRLQFISIFWSNLQEFFMVRVGSLTDMALVKQIIVDNKSGMTPAQQLSAIYKRTAELYPYYEQCYNAVHQNLAQEGVVNITNADDLSDEALCALDDYMKSNVLPFLSPQIINTMHPFPHLENGELYIVVRLDVEGAEGVTSGASAGKQGGKHKEGKGSGAQDATLGIIPLPRQAKRIIPLPGKGTQFILLEHAIELYADQVFSMYKVKHTNIICVTRNADLDTSEGIDEQGEDYRAHMKRILKKRSRLAPVRLECEHNPSATVQKVLLDRLGLKPSQVFVTHVPLDMSFAWALPAMVSEKKRARLAYEPFTPQWPERISRQESITSQVQKRDILLSYPYESMDPFVQLLREAAADPSVTSIKITLYRLAKTSHLAEALIAAAEAGKEVTALFELRARFDESNNIEWSQRFEQAGCHVIYGFRDFKVHSKICCITRQTSDGIQYITQLGTGNYNEKTAELYTDFSFITTNAAIGADATQFFKNMLLENTSDAYDVMWVAPLQIKQKILAGIDRQIERHRAGKSSGLFFKTNSITDKEIIDKIAQASQEGVKCVLLVRGISCLVPGIVGYTENVRVVSIVGRLLEHSRIYCFGALNSNVKIYLSSADLMTRNMDKRIEIAWPVLDKTLRSEVVTYIKTSMSDTAKLRELRPNKKYTPLHYFAEKNSKGHAKKLFDSQKYLIERAQSTGVDAPLTGPSTKAWATGSIDYAAIAARQYQDELERERELKSRRRNIELSDFDSQGEAGAVAAAAAASATAAAKEADTSAATAGTSGECVTSDTFGVETKNAGASEPIRAKAVIIDPETSDAQVNADIIDSAAGADAGAGAEYPDDYESDSVAIKPLDDVAAGDAAGAAGADAQANGEEESIFDEPAKEIIIPKHHRTVFQVIKDFFKKLFS